MKSTTKSELKIQDDTQVTVAFRELPSLAALIGPELKIRAAFLHQSITWPGEAGSERSITTSKIPTVEIRIVKEGILLSKPKADTMCFVGESNIANIVIEKLK